MTWDRKKIAQQQTASDPTPQPEALHPASSAADTLPSIAYQDALLTDPALATPLPPTQHQLKELHEMGLFHESEWAGIRRRMYHGVMPIHGSGKDEWPD